MKDTALLTLNLHMQTHTWRNDEGLSWWLFLAQIKHHTMGIHSEMLYVVF